MAVVGMTFEVLLPSLLMGLKKHFIVFNTIYGKSITHAYCIRVDTMIMHVEVGMFVE